MRDELKVPWWMVPILIALMLLGFLIGYWSGGF